MQASDYRYVDVAGVSIADKILPKIYDSSGGAKVERAEDLAFLWEAVSERSGRVFRLMPNDFEPGTGIGSLNRLYRFNDPATFSNAGSSLPSAIADQTAPPGPTTTDGWFDWTQVSQLTIRTGQGSNVPDMLSLWPGLVTAAPIPEDNGRYSCERIMVEPLRHLYARLAHSEGFAAGYYVTTNIKGTYRYYRKEGTGLESKYHEEEYGRIGVPGSWEQTWSWEPADPNDPNDQDEETRHAFELAIDPYNEPGDGFPAGDQMGSVRYTGDRGLIFDTGNVVFILRALATCYPVGQGASPEYKWYAYYVNSNVASAGPRFQLQSIVDMIYRDSVGVPPRKNKYRAVSIVYWLGPCLFAFTGRTSIRDLLGGAWDPT